MCGAAPSPPHPPLPCPGERTPEGFFVMKGGIDAAIARGLSYAPYADMVWFETGEPNMEEAKKFAAALHAQYPGDDNDERPLTPKGMSPANDEHIKLRRPPAAQKA